MGDLENIVIVGGGAAGYFTAIHVAKLRQDAKVYLLEATQKPLAKVLISGGGRCNVTHAKFEPKELVAHYPRGQKELLGAFSKFQPKDTIAFFASQGVALKTEKDGRMFPKSNKSETIASCLKAAASQAGVTVKLGFRVSDIKKEGHGFVVYPKKGDSLFAHKLVLATGSSPFGHKMAAQLGHRIIDPVPSLFTFTIKDPLLKDLMGISFPKAKLKLSFDDKAKKPYEAEGPLLITHWGLSGPAVLRLSAFGARCLKEAKYKAKLTVNFCPDESLKEVEGRLLAYKAKEPKSVLAGKPLHPFARRFWARQLETLEIKKNQTFGQTSDKILRALALHLAAYEMRVVAKGVFKEEFVTAGGVCLKEVDFRTLESKKVKGLYFAGEILDVDGVTGGFNFQNAWTTGFMAAQNI